MVSLSYAVVVTGLDIEDIMELRAQGVNPWDEDAIVSIIHLTLSSDGLTQSSIFTRMFYVCSAACEFIVGHIYSGLARFLFVKKWTAERYHTNVLRFH